MKDIKEILKEGRNANDIITDLKYKDVSVPNWDGLAKDYYSSNHKIVNDVARQPRSIEGGKLEEPAKLTIALEKLLTSRINDFTFAVPVKRKYTNIDGNKTREMLANAIENVYKHARIDNENLERGIAYYAGCEFFTFWYVVEKQNTLYGFPCKYKLKCKTFSPMDGTKLYPLFDEVGDMIAMSFEYVAKVGDDKINFFETFTENSRYKWKQLNESNEWELVEQNDTLSIGKIPGVYQCRTKPVWDGLSHLRNELEYTLSRNSDIVAYNAAPVVKVKGTIIGGEEEKGATRRIYNVSEGGDVDYVSWNQSVEATKYHIETLLRLFFMQAQMPDISFKELVSVGNVSYDTLRTLLMDSSLKIGDEAGKWIPSFERECNVIKAFLGQMNVEFKSELDNVDVEHEITPFVIDSEKEKEERIMRMNGGKSLLSHVESIRMLGYSGDPERTKKEIDEEEANSTANTISNLFNESAM